MILGISRNTINNYITSVMRKTATKTRSEAIAFAVRNNLGGLTAKQAEEMSQAWRPWRSYAVLHIWSKGPDLER